ncbi:MAG TPA: hypothetical protein VMV90_08130 [Rectinemataceae bacterium]|nr:hypothetical protein [Rectinemataceae bacterium]
MGKPSFVRDEITPRSVIAVLALSFALGAAFLMLALGLASCSSSVVGSIAPEGGAELTIDLAISPPLADKLRRLSQTQPGKPLFDSSAIRKSIESRSDLRLVSLSEPSPDSVRAVVAVPSILRLASSPELRGTRLIAIARGPGWQELRVRLERGHAAALTRLFPGIDPDLVDSLSPPALETDPTSVSDYRSMLASVFGERVMPALDSARLRVSLSAPAEVLDSGGGKLEGRTLEVSVPAIDALVLEKPIEFWLRWKS